MVKTDLDFYGSPGVMTDLATFDDSLFETWETDVPELTTSQPAS